MKFKEYSKTLPLAKRIYDKLFGNPKSHDEWANRFNKVGDINREIILSKEELKERFKREIC